MDKEGNWELIDEYMGVRIIIIRMNEWMNEWMNEQQNIPMF